MVISFRDQASYTVENVATHANMDKAISPAGFSRDRLYHLEIIAA